MSLLLSDSLIGLVDESTLDGDYSDTIGAIHLNGKKYEIDSFVTDRKVIRVHAVGNSNDAISIMNLKQDLEAKISLGNDAYTASGKIHQIGFEQLSHGGRIIISVIVRDK